MRLKTLFHKDSKHRELVSCVGWLNADEVFSAGDDPFVMKSNILSGESIAAVQLSNGVYATDLHWFPKSIGGKKQGPAEVFVLTAADGKFYFISKNGRIEKSVEAHRGATLAGKWSYDGNALVTAGEDGQVKIWSRSGMLRSTLVSLAVPVYSVAWSANSDAILHTNGKQLTIKPLQPSAKQQQWKAHDGLVLKVDWNTVNNTIISGGEDCKYKVWDVFGRALFTSMSHDYPITSIAWAPDGDMFAVGSYNTLRLCDKAGWSYALEKPESGSLFNIAWANDGMQVAAACGNGQALFAHIVERRAEWKNLEVVVSEAKHIKVRDVMTDAKENLDFRDRVVKFAIGYDHLVVTTPSQCYTYSTKNWNTPMIFDLKSGSVSLVLLAEKHFLLLDDTGIQVYTYEGRMISTPRYNGMRPDLLNRQIVSISNDTIVIRDRNDEKGVPVRIVNIRTNEDEPGLREFEASLLRLFDKITNSTKLEINESGTAIYCIPALYFFEALTGKPLGDGKPVRHNTDIVEIALNQDGASSERQLALIDKSKDLYLRTVRQFGADRVVKLATMVTSICWNDTCNMLTTVSDHKLSIWYHPAVAYIDQDLLKKTCLTREQGEFGKDVHVVSFVKTYCSMRRGDGALCSTNVSPYPAFLHKYVAESKWSEAVRLCRFVKDQTLWACLAGMAASHKELSTAEIAYAAIEEVEKVQFINFIKEIPSTEGRSAGMALLCGHVQDAENILLQSDVAVTLAWRRLFTNESVMNLSRSQYNKVLSTEFDHTYLNKPAVFYCRAIELAVKHKTHVDTVLAYRSRYLKRCNKEETSKKFLQFAQGEKGTSQDVDVKNQVIIDWDKIKVKIEMELEKEAERGGMKTR